VVGERLLWRCVHACVCTGARSLCVSVCGGKRPPHSRASSRCSPAQQQSRARVLSSLVNLSGCFTCVFVLCGLMTCVGPESSCVCACCLGQSTQINYSRSNTMTNEDLNSPPAGMEFVLPSIASALLAAPPPPPPVPRLFDLMLHNVCACACVR
jgi:hypothetical protein